MPCSVFGEKLINIKVRNLSILAAKCTFWRQISYSIQDKLPMPEYIDSVYSTSYSTTLAVIWQKKNPAIKVLNYGVGVSWRARTQALALNKIGLGLRNSYIQYRYKLYYKSTKVHSVFYCNVMYCNQIHICIINIRRPYGENWVHIRP